MRRSVTETYDRQDIERVFEVRRVTAQSLTEAIGEIQNIGCTYIVARTAILRYLEAVEAAPDLTTAHRERLQLAEPAPRRKSLKFDLPEDLRSVMPWDLPPGSRSSLAASRSAGRIPLPFSRTSTC